ncbi:MAG: PucR family transcriptional regulator, partial [Anaerolineales bacterium]
MHAVGITLQQLLRLSFADSVDWLSEQPKDDVSIRWVVLSSDEVASGDVLLIPGDELVPKKVEQTLAQGGVAVIIWGPPASVDAAFPSQIPVVAVPKEQKIREVHRTLLTILVNQRAYLMERGVRIHAQLSQLEAEGQGIPGLALAMSEISGRGVLIQDKRLRLLAECASSTLNSIWDDIIEQLSGPENLPEALRDRKAAGRSIPIISQSLPGGIARIIIPIVVREVARGYLSLVGLEGEFDDLDDLVAEQGAIVCAVEMARAKAVREAEKRVKGDLLSAILYESLTPRDSHLWIQSIGLDLEHSHVALRFAWDGEKTPSLRRLETLVNGEISQRALTAIVEALGAEVACIFELPAGITRPEPAIEFGNAILDRAAQEYPKIAARCGVGMPVSVLSEWRDSFRQAGQALEMARRLAEGRTLYFPNLSVNRLLLQLENHPELPVFKKEILGALLDYDSNEQLIQTLEAFFE